MQMVSASISYVVLYNKLDIYCSKNHGLRYTEVYQCISSVSGGTKECCVNAVGVQKKKCTLKYAV